MNFRLPSQPDPSDRPKLKFGRSPYFQGNASQARRPSHRNIVALVFMLMFVLIAMREAAKPERWHWLLPPDENQKSAIDSVIPLDERDAESMNEEDSRRQTSRPVENVVDRSGDPSHDPPLHPSSLPPHPSSPSPRFWQNTLRRMDSHQRITLYQLLKRIRHGETLPANDIERFESLVNFIEQGRQQFHSDHLSELAFSRESPQEKASLANELYESEQSWKQHELPSLQAALQSEAISDEQRSAMEQLQAVLDPTIDSFVSDWTAQGWEGDSPAWGRMWELIFSGHLPPPDRVSHLELMAQPHQYRSLHVRVRGSIQSAWQEPLSIRDFGIDQLFVLVIRPDDSNVSPFFVYADELPAGFPPLSRRPLTMDEPVVVDGLFFKIRTYLDSERQVQNGPMILASRIEPVASAHVAIGPIRGPLPEVTKGVWGVGLLMLVLIGIATMWFAFRSRQRIRFNPGPNRTREIHEDLQSLIGQEGPKTDQERIQELYDQ